MMPFSLSSIVIFLLSGAPLFVSIGLGSALIMIFGHHMPIRSIVPMMIGPVASWPMLAMPLFILAGALMLSGGSAKRMVDFFNAAFGHMRGGLIVVVVAFCTLFSALSGSGLAAIAAVGTIMFPEMRRQGYSDKLSTGVVAVTGELGVLIPPSILFIILGMLMQTSAASLFAAGVVPGLLLALVFCIIGLFLAKKEGIKVAVKRAGWRVIGDTFVKAIPAVIMPIIILGGIYSGLFTPTEAASVSCVYAILVGAVVYRGFTWQSFWGAFVSTAKISGVMYIMIASIALFSYIISVGGAPKALAGLVIQAGLSQTQFVCVLCASFIILGFVFEAWPMMWILIPLLLPTFAALDINLLWMGVLFCVGTMIGQVTPPMCVVVYFTSKIAKVPPGTVIKGIIPFLIAEVIVLFVLIFVPELSLWFPRVMGMR